MSDEQRQRPFSDDEYRMHWDEPFDSVKLELMQLSSRLAELLPDPSLGPMERIERLARVVPQSLLVSVHRLSARTKLQEMRRRLDELVSDDLASGYPAKLEWLVNRLDELVPGEQRTLVKLETIGDCRGADTGVSPRLWQ